ncbi:hypothetical protein [Vibrio aquimaris]|uniref:Uncharacterized protein n=1 Tax=Vibrio aquimaris TaxID=2587862 RepID=A0A5P9CRG0_9VIBR|nr:hypothetical protein [Vibrio aquimaris]QFT28855.1 hypothetical protein FIV01_20850 [Vibrio aquimaris]
MPGKISEAIFLGVVMRQAPDRLKLELRSQRGAFSINTKADIRRRAGSPQKLKERKLGTESK